MSVLLQGVKLLRNDASLTEVDAANHLRNKIVALYFSEEWCPPCQQFAPRLAKFYEIVGNSGFEVVLVSDCDESEEAFFRHLRTSGGGWCALKFGEPKIVELKQKYNVQGVPLLVVIASDGEVISDSGREEIEAEGANAQQIFEIWHDPGQKVYQKQKRKFICCE